MNLKIKILQSKFTYRHRKPTDRFYEKNEINLNYECFSLYKTAQRLVTPGLQ